MTWSEAVAGPLAGATCLWQDLDGLHVHKLPATPPPTSILWGWTGEGKLLRARLDGDMVYLAQCHEAGTPHAAAQPWSVNDNRVAAYRAADGTEAAGLGTAYVQVVVHPEEDGLGPVTFVRPVPEEGDD